MVVADAYWKKISVKNAIFSLIREKVKKNRFHRVKEPSKNEFGVNFQKSALFTKIGIFRPMKLHKNAIISIGPFLYDKIIKK